MAGDDTTAQENGGSGGAKRSPQSSSVVSRIWAGVASAVRSPSASDISNVQARANANAKRVLVAGPVMMFLGIVVIAVFSAQATCGRFLSLFGVLIVLAIASLVVGGFIGFLFGIPRATAERIALERATAASETATATENAAPHVEGRNKPLPPVGRGPSSRHEVNTNLEEISDWLTKIIVGVSLVQFTEIFNFLNTVTENVDTSFNEACAYFPTTCISGLKIFTGGDIVLYFALGLHFGYLWTRLLVQGAIRDSDLSLVGALQEEVEEKRIELSRAQEKNQATTEALNMTDRALNPFEKDEPSQENLDAALLKASQDARILIFHRARSFRDACRMSGNLQNIERTIPIFKALINADRIETNDMPIYHRNFAELGYALKDKSAPNYKEAFEALDRAISIRGSDRGDFWRIYEFNRAVCRMHLDPDFQNNQKTTDTETVEKIRMDLAAASQNAWIKQNVIANDSDVRKWTQLNPA